MTMVDYIRAAIDYHYALYRRVWDSIIQVNDEQFVRDIPYSQGSLRNQIIHVAAVDGRWLRGLRDDPAARQYTLDPADYPDRLSARAVWDATERDMTAYVATLDAVGLERHPQGMPGPTWHALTQVVNHGTDHRAQMLRILHDFGAPTFDQDFIFHVWRR